MNKTFDELKACGQKLLFKPKQNEVVTNVLKKYINSIRNIQTGNNEFENNPNENSISDDIANSKLINMVYNKDELFSGDNLNLNSNLNEKEGRENKANDIIITDDNCNPDHNRNNQRQNESDFMKYSLPLQKQNNFSNQNQMNHNQDTKGINSLKLF